MVAINEGTAVRSAHLPDLFAKKTLDNQLPDLGMQLLDLALAIRAPSLGPLLNAFAACSSSCFFQA
ncbi:hypothetical protein IVB30_32190 [Bradyrhizobium sp. 200]|nr:hypothetical protein IVB30_32190 [Bradyrhizobium sp. 200]